MNINLQQQSYRWNGVCWLDSDGLVVPDRLGAELNRRYLERWWNEQGGAEVQFAGQAAHRLALLRRRADDHQSGPGLRWVETMARQYLGRFPRDPAILAVLCASLRAQGQSRQALQVGLAGLEPTCPQGQTALRTTLAAAYCDTGQWVKARELLPNSPNLYADQVARRIDNHCA